MALKGIDVSSYQGNINWEKVKKTGIDFAILKIIRQDLNPDKNFEKNWKNCKAAKMPVQGVYNYSYATTVSKAKSDAEKVVKILNGRKTFVWLDVEDRCQQNIGKKLIDIINAYKNVIKRAGLDFGVYTGLSFYNSYILPYAGQINCPFWIARYPLAKGMKVNENPSSSKKPVIKHTLYGWQYTSALSVSGIANSVDGNLLYVSVTQGDGNTKNTLPAPIVNPTENWKGNKEYYLENKYVGEWQKAMNAGFDVNALTVDNKFGADSQRFAKNHNLWSGQKHNCPTAIKWLRKTLHDRYGFSKLDVNEKKWTDYLTLCVEVFQKNRGLKQDGCVGLITTYDLLKG